MVLRFVKMHGLGNDFVVIDDLSSPAGSRAPVDAGLSRRLCDRRFGIGADQLVWLLPPERPGADARVRFFNADGSEAEMCGNGIRAVAVYLSTSGPRPGRDRYEAETAGGPQVLDLKAGEVRVRMSTPALGRGFVEGGHPIAAAGRETQGFEVSVGNPHFVIFVERLEGFPAEELGPAIERHPDYPQRINVEFVEVKGRGRLAVRVWERGAGFTLACGTGACAAAAAAIATGRAQSPVEVELPGGSLRIEWDGKGGPLWMSGPAVEVYRGEFRL